MTLVMDLPNPLPNPLRSKEGENKKTIEPSAQTIADVSPKV